MIDLPIRRTSAKTDYVADQPIYLDASGKVVGAKDPAKHMKLVHTGGRIPYEEAVRYGLIEVASAEPVAVVKTAPEQAEQAKQPALPVLDTADDLPKKKAKR